MSLLLLCYTVGSYTAASGACEAITGCIYRLAGAAAAGTDKFKLAATIHANSASAEDANATVDARAVALELLLGAMSNLAPYRIEEVLEVSSPHP